MQKKIILIIILLTGIMLWTISCTKQSADKLAANLCDTLSMKYSTDIVPILQDNCYNCHGTNNTLMGEGVLLQGYQNLLPWVQNGFLIGDITHSPGFVPMPADGNPFSACEVNKIIAWVNQGALDN